MKKIILQELELTNFKGFSYKKIKFKEKITNILGENASGKTTIFDSFIWLLFGYDSLGRATLKANIRPLDENNNLIHYVDCVVKAILLVDDEKVELKREYKENWVKKRGELEKEFKGNVTEYYINDLKVKEKEYTSKIEEIIDLETFKLITDPNYFNNLEWKKQREIIMKSVGEIDEKMIIESNPKLAELDTKEDIEIQKERAKQKLSGIKKQEKELPIRLSELNLNIAKKQEELKTLDDSKIVEIEEEIKKQNIKKDDLKQKKYQIELKIEKFNNVENEKRKLVNEMEFLKKTHKLNFEKEYNSLMLEYEKNNSLIRDEERKISTINSNVDFKNNEINKLRDMLKTIKKRVNEVESLKYDLSKHKNYCNHCQQPIPLDQLAKLQEKDIKQFEEDKKAKLNNLSLEEQQIISKGKTLKEEIEKLENEKRELEVNRTTVIEKPKEIEIDYTEIINSNQYKELEKQLSLLETTSIQDDKNELIKIDSDIKMVESGITLKQQELKTIRTKEMIENDIKQLEERKEELKKEQINLANEMNYYSKIEFLCNLFMQEKINIIQSIVSNLFNGLKFKMYDEQINGGLAETCQLLHNGTPYSSLNFAQKINCGLLVIKSLCEINGITAPVFIDNRESITEIEELESQVINLSVPNKEFDIDIKL